MTQLGTTRGAQYDLLQATRLCNIKQASAASHLNSWRCAKANLRQPKLACEDAGERFGQTAEIETVRNPRMEVKLIQPRQVAATEEYV
jgi:hypothetical protein